MKETPKHVRYDERPKPTIQNIPDEIIEEIIGRCADYGECPYCETPQWYPKIDGRESEWDCAECGEAMAIIG